MIRSKTEWTVRFILAVAITAIGVACAVNPISRAETSEQKVYAVYGTWVIVEEEVANLLTDDSALSDSARLSLANAAERARPVMSSLLDAYNQYEAVRAQFEAQTTTEEKLQLALDDLDSWVVRAQTLVQNFKQAEREARQ